MSRWLRNALTRPARLVLGIDLQQLAVFDPANSQRAVHAGHDALATVLPRASSRSILHIVAATDLARHWVQAPPASIASLAELRQVAAARCAHLHGGSPSDWHVAADWNADRPFVCAALPADLVTRVTREATQSGLQTRWHTAWGLFCSRYAHRMPKQGWVAMRTRSRIALWHCEAGAADDLGILHIDPQSSEEQAVQHALQHIQVAALRLGRPAMKTVAWIGLHAQPVSPRHPAITPIVFVELPTEPFSTEAATASWIDSLQETRS